MKKVPFLSLISGILLAGITSCSTSVISDDPDPVNPESETKTLNIRVVSNDFTRAGESDIQSLYLAFYKGTSTTPEIIKAFPDESNNSYTVQLAVDPSDPPQKVVAFANFTDEDKNTMMEALANTPARINDIQPSSDGYFMMSSAVYYNGEQLVKSSPVTSENIYGNTPIDIYLDRLAAKVTVEKASDAAITAPNITGSDNLTLEIVGWGLTATDNSSYLLKQIPESVSSLTWITKNEHSFGWAKSINYGSFSTTPDINKITLGGANIDLSSPLYTHESTRNSDDLRITDSRPSVILVGKYQKDGQPMNTFYRMRSGEKNLIFTEEELWEKIAAEQDFLLIKEEEASDYSKPTAEYLKKVMNLSTPSQEIAGEKIPNFGVTPQLIGEATKLYNSNNIEYDKATLNTLLYNRFRLFEKYNEGKCIFIVPIVHNKDNNIYGLVRNHSYTLTIKSIEGFGRGIADETSEISDETIPELESSYTINSTLHVNTWTTINQEINIPTSKQ